MRVLIIALFLFYPAWALAIEKTIVIGQTQESRLDDKSPNHDGIAYETWVFSGKAGQQITIEMTSNDFDSVLKLSAPNGALIKTDDNSGIGYNARIVTSLPMDGNYSIEATAIWQMRTGNYRLTVTNIEIPIKTGKEKLFEDVKYYEDCLLATKDATWASELHTGRLLVLLQLQADNRAVEAAELAVVLAEKSGDKFALAKAYLAITNRLLRDEEYEGAVKYFGEVLKIQRELNNRTGEANTLSALADAYLSLGNFEGARKYHQQTLAIYQELKDRRSEGFALFGLAQSYRLERLPKQAIPYYEQALACAKEVNNRSGEGYALFGLADCQRSLEQYDQAFTLYESALKASREDNDYTLQGIILAAVADIYRFQAKYDKAVPYYEQNLIARRETKDLRGQAYTLNAIGFCERNLKQFASAVKRYDKMLSICHEIKDRKGESIALLGLGVSYRSLKQYKESVTAYEQALIIVREIKDRKAEYNALTGLGIAYNGLNQASRALPYLEQALAMNQEPTDKVSLATLLEAITVASFISGQYDQAASNCEKLINCKQETEDKTGEAKSLLLESLIASKRGDLNKANNSYQRAREIFAEQKNVLGTYSCHYGLAKIANQKGDNKTAQAEYEKAINLIENNTQVVVEDVLGLVTPLQVYQNYIEMLAAQQQFPAALAVAERIRVYQFHLSLEKSLSNSQDKNTAEFFKPFTSVGFNEILQTAQRLNATILNYLSLENGLLISVVKPDGTVVGQYNKIDLSRLNSLIDQYRSLMEAKNLRGEKLRAALGEDLIDSATATVNTSIPANLDEELRNLLLPDSILTALPVELESKLLVVANGKLATIPFSALKDNQGSYLLDRFIILESPSISTLAITYKLRSKTELIARVESLAIGLSPNNTVNNNSLPSIADNKDELKAATNFKAKSLTGITAVKSGLCEQGKGKHILHFITYSYISDKQPLKSFILLTPQTNEQGAIVHNGNFTLGELENCVTDNDLIILTSNQAGFSPSSGDGLFFLANTLAINNNSASLLTLWQTDGKITSTFMEAFYEQLKKTPDIAISYHKALIKLREKYKNPAQWAPFVLIGEPIN